MYMDAIYIYKHKKLNFPLTDEEYNLISDVWNFINKFKIGHITMHEYRNKIINQIKNNYSLNEFTEFEKIAEKIYWNLRNKLIKNYKDYEEFDLNEYDKIKEKLMKENYYRSFINKIINIDLDNKKLLYKKMEGSAPIFTKNINNCIISEIFYNRKLYEYVMKNKLNIDEIKIKIPKIYYQMDYAFPNLNICKPFIYKDNHRISRIQSMYYDNNCENNWTNLIINKIII